ncbi:hypothetical protein B7486_13470 [cyanobacterium TDX16]|nr:hypothetical protein B7486_13470 [cyanobacterium TDX16]
MQPKREHPGLGRDEAAKAVELTNYHDSSLLTPLPHLLRRTEGDASGAVIERIASTDRRSNVRAKWLTRCQSADSAAFRAASARSTATASAVSGGRSN